VRDLVVNSVKTKRKERFLSSFEMTDGIRNDKTSCNEAEGKWDRLTDPALGKSKVCSNDGRAETLYVASYGEFDSQRFGLSKD